MRFLLTISLIAIGFVAGCQKAQVAEFKKFQADSEVPRITLPDAKKEYDAGTAVIVDSRGEAQYKQEHVTGSINIPFPSPDTEFAKLPQGKKIIVYCS